LIVDDSIVRGTTSFEIVQMTHCIHGLLEPEMITHLSV